MTKEITELSKIRRDKLNSLKKLGYSGYEKHVSYTDTSITLKDKYSQFSKEELETQSNTATIVGRVMTRRGPFIIGKDSSGPIQIYIGKDAPQKIVEIKELLDIGDIVQAKGIVMKTNTGAISIKASEFLIITKSLTPLPEKFHGLKDVEERYRRRHVDLIMNDKTKETFITRSKIISSVRAYFDDLEYLEVDTPMLQSILGGASAKPFTTFHNALNLPFYLRIATELPLKKLLVGGIDRVYEIGRIFRNEGIDTTHNPEFTSIEFYEAYSDLNGMIQRTENLIVSLAKKLNKEEILFKGNNIKIKAPFARINMVEAVNEKTGLDFYKISFDEAKEAAKKYKIKIEPFFKIGHIINELFELLIEETLIQPTFVTGHPLEISPLASKDNENPNFTERAELFIGANEYANMFTELNDPIDQLERFESQLFEKESGNDEASEIDLDFIDALEIGMPPAGGCGIGIDRLVMLLTQNESIREVLLFPHLKNKNGMEKDE